MSEYSLRCKTCNSVLLKAVTFNVTLKSTEQGYQFRISFDKTAFWDRPSQNLLSLGEGKYSNKLITKIDTMYVCWIIIY